MNEEYFKILFKEAKKALKSHNIPIGCIIVKNEKIIAKGHNIKERTQNAIDHAEIIAIKKACKKLHTWRLNDCTLYVTLKPCDMCIGAIREARIKKVIFLLDSNYEKINKQKIDFINLNNQIYKEMIINFFNSIR